LLKGQQEEMEWEVVEEVVLTFLIINYYALMLDFKFLLKIPLKILKFFIKNSIFFKFSLPIL
jgi:hypothetical protein